jgi:hypothetical protein
MYLFVFVFLLMGILGLYTEVFSLQSAHQFAQQAGIAQTMLLWHNAAVAYAKTNKGSLAGLTVPCYVSSGAPVCSLTPVFSVSANLPNGYNAAYTFPSVVFSSAAQYYLLTYVAPPSAAKLDGPVTTPPIGFTVGEILRQIQNTGVSPMIYGAVKSDVLTTKAVITGINTLTYTLPAGLVADGSVGFISPL